MTPFGHWHLLPSRLLSAPSELSGSRLLSARAYAYALPRAELPYEAECLATGSCAVRYGLRGATTPDGLGAEPDHAPGYGNSVPGGAAAYSMDAITNSAAADWDVLSVAAAALSATSRQESGGVAPPPPPPPPPPSPAAVAPAYTVKVGDPAAPVYWRCRE